LDAAPIWTDLKTFPWGQFCDRVDILSGGYPCQPFSAAGKRLGTEDPRHLWPHIASGIRAMRPRICFFENVEGHITLGLREVVAELESMGYAVSWGIFSAAEVGAPHQRKRVFILAHSIIKGLERFAGHENRRTKPGWFIQKKDRSASESSVSIWPTRPGQPQHQWEPPRVVGDSENRTRFRETSRQGRHASQSNQTVGNSKIGEDNRREFRNLDKTTSQWGCGDNVIDGSNENLGKSPRQLFKWSGPVAKQEGGAKFTNANKWQTQPSVGGTSDGIAGGMDYAELCVACDNRTDELRLLGNGVVPATAEKAFRTLMEKLL
jgi:site-specific DNA-cytosine methylase